MNELVCHTKPVCRCSGDDAECACRCRNFLVCLDCGADLFPVTQRRARGISRGKEAAMPTKKKTTKAAAGKVAKRKKKK